MRNFVVSFCRLSLSKVVDFPTYGRTLPSPSSLRVLNKLHNYSCTTMSARTVFELNYNYWEVFPSGTLQDFYCILETADWYARHWYVHRHFSHIVWVCLPFYSFINTADKLVMCTNQYMVQIIKFEKRGSHVLPLSIVYWPVRGIYIRNKKTYHIVQGKW